RTVDDAVDFPVIERSHVGKLLGTARKRHVVYMGICRAGNGIHPVGIAAVIGAAIGQVFAAAHDGERPVHLLRSTIRIVCDAGAIAATGLGGDNDYTTGAAVAVEGSGPTVFQLIQAGDVIGVYAVQVCTYHAIDNYQRLRVGTQGRQAPKPDIELTIGVALRGDNTKSGHLALQQLCRVIDVAYIELLGLDVGNSTGDLA